MTNIAKYRELKVFWKNPRKNVFYKKVKWIWQCNFYQKKEEDKTGGCFCSR